MLSRLFQGESGFAKDLSSNIPPVKQKDIPSNLTSIRHSPQGAVR